MKSRLLVAAVACLGYAILNATPAHAVEDMSFIPESAEANWESDGSWYTNGCDRDPEYYAGDGNYPESTHTVRICSGKTAWVTTSTPRAKTVYLETNVSGTYIKIDPGEGGATLTLGSGSSDLTSTLSENSEISLVADATYKPILRFLTDEDEGPVTYTHTVTGDGAIRGYENDAEIQIDDYLVLTNGLDIGGAMHIKDVSGCAGTLDNQGRVIADYEDGTLDVRPTTIDDTSGSGRWQVTASGAYLRFIVEPQPLDGSFTVSDGTLRAGTDVSSDDIDVCTSGDLSHSGGKIIAGVSDSFSFNCASCPCAD